MWRVKSTAVFRSNLTLHNVAFGCGSMAAGDKCGEALRMAFGKKHVEDRKAWLSAFVPGTFLDSEASRVSYDDFVNKARPCPLSAAAGRREGLQLLACSALFRAV